MNPITKSTNPNTLDVYTTDPMAAVAAEATPVPPVTALVVRPSFLTHEMR